MKRAKSPSKHNIHAGEGDYEKYLEDDDGDDSPYGSPSIKRTCLPSSKSVQSPSVPGDAKSVFAVLDGGDPNACLAIFRQLLEALKTIPLYYKDTRILLDMQELEMLVHGCGASTASTRISRLREGSQNGILEKVKIPGRPGHPKVGIELRNVLEYVVAQKGEVASALRRSLIEIASRAVAGDQDLFRAVSEWKKTMDPKIRATLMSGYVRSETAMREDPLPNPEEVAEPLPEDVSEAIPSEAPHAAAAPPPPPQLLTWQEAKLELINADVCPRMLASPMGALIVMEMRLHGLLSAMNCVQKQMTIFNEWVESQARIARLDKAAQEETARLKAVSDAKIEDDRATADRLKKANDSKIAAEKAKSDRLKSESDAKIAADKAESDRLKSESDAAIASKAAADKAESDRLKSESEEKSKRLALESEAKSVAIIKINAANAKIELLEKKQALATKARLDQATIDAERAKVDIEETKAWRMRQDMAIKKNESEARIRREDLNSALLRKQQRKIEASIPVGLAKTNYFNKKKMNQTTLLNTSPSGFFVKKKH
jgi:hypothetical protein